MDARRNRRDAQREVGQYFPDGIPKKLEDRLGISEVNVPSLPPPPLPDKPSKSFPEGGVRGWCVVAGSAGLTFCTYGYIGAFGVLQEYYQRNQLRHHSASEIAWIGSLQTYLLFITSLFGGPLFDMYGGMVIWPPVAIYVFSVMMTSVCTEYWHFIIAQSVLGGSAIGLAVAPSVAAVSHYFHRKRDLAIGMTVASSCIGGVVFPIMLGQMLPRENIGFGWAIRICGFAMLLIMLPSAYAIKARLRPRSVKLFQLRAFRSWFYVLTIVAGIFMLLGIFVPLFFLPSFAVSYGMNTEQAAYLIAIYNASSLFGRFLPGLLAEHFGRLNVFFATAIATGILGYCWQAATTPAGLYTFSVLYGFLSGAVVSMFSMCLGLAAKSSKKIGIYLSMGLALSSTATLVGPPIGGIILSASDFARAADFCGTASLLGAIFIILAKQQSGMGLLAVY